MLHHKFMPMPLRRQQVEAGAALRRLLNPWNSTDHALQLLAERFPEPSLEACLIKTATLNALYNTNAYAVWRMGEHVHRVLKKTSHPTGPELVDVIARLDSKRAHRSFASKFAHFFIDAEAFPILDQYVVKMLTWHLGNSRAWPKDYVEFHGWFQQLRVLCDEPFPNKDLDQYLWIAGMYREFQRSGRKYLSEVVSSLFEQENPVTAQLLANLDPSSA